MSLQERVANARGDWREAARILRRARHLYIRFAWPAIKADKTPKTMIFCVDRMIEAGLYAQPIGLRSVRFSILRRAWKNETGAPQRFGHPDGWHFWYRRNGFTLDFQRNAEAVA